MEEQDFLRIERIAKEASQNVSLVKVQEVAQEAATVAIISVHKSLGIDVDNHLETQKDFAYIRKARQREEDTISRFYSFILKGTIIAIIAGVGARWDKIIHLVK